MKRYPALDHRHHVAEEERQEQRPDVGAVHVGIRHEDDLVVPELPEVELVRADAGAQRRDQEPDFLVGQHLVVARLLGVDDLAPERQDRLDPPVAALLRRAAGRVALHEEDLPHRGIALGALRQLPGQVVAVEALLARELARLARRLARLRGVHALLGDLPRAGGILLEGLGELVVDDRLDEAADLAVAELGLRLALELGLRQPHRDDRGEALADVVAGDRSLEALQVPVRLRVRTDRPRQRRAEPRQVGAPLAGVDVVREREDVLLVAVVVLERDLDLDVAPAALEVLHLRVHRRLVLVDVLDELADAARVVER